MDYEKMFFSTNTTKMPDTNCLAPQATTSLLLAPLKVSPTVTNNFLQPIDPYSTYADNFDLSLLPQDCALPTENIPTTVYNYTADTPTTPTSTPPQIKIEQIWSCASDEIKQEQTYAQPLEHLHHNHQHHQHQQQHQQQRIQLTKSPNQLIPPPAYPQQQIYPSPQSSPAQSEYGFSHRQFAGCYDSLCSSPSSLYASSPCPSIDASNIKQELHILPPSPPESNCEAPSPHYSCADIKTEPFDADVEALIDLNTLLEKPFKQQTVPLQHQDHQLLREYLEDTTFQRKHNLKPLALESFFGGLDEVRGDIEPVISLALEHAKREADETCAKLQISQDPSAWSPIQVHAWLRSTIAQFKLPHIDELEMKFCEDGAALILLSEEEFTRRAPECGSTLHAQLEIWKMAYSDGYQHTNTPAAQQQQQEANEAGMGGNMPMQQQQNIWPAVECLPSVDMDLPEESEFEEDALQSSSSTSVATSSAPSAATTSTTSTVKRPATGAARSGGGSHIHLWQFLKELLAAPHVNGTAIRWIDRNKGIFKIEDSVRVAKLWGRRKNRPAMNYDKLSRSIRQYYKKGIMKKTERSQRLVYQFCHPYHM